VATARTSATVAESAGAVPTEPIGQQERGSASAEPSSLGCPADLQMRARTSVCYLLWQPMPEVEMKEE